MLIAIPASLEAPCNLRALAFFQAKSDEDDGYRMPDGLVRI